MTFKNETLDFLAKIDNDFDNIQDQLIDELGDEANDIGDAGNALELISNQISETHISYKATQFRHTLSKLTGIPQHKIKHIFMYLELLPEKYPAQLKDLQTDYKKQSA